MLRDQLNTLLEPVVRKLGYELWELEYAARHGSGYLRLYIDRPQSSLQPTAAKGTIGDADSEGASGITVDDCARVSHAVSEVMDAEDPLPGSYTLEVSSPGLDRVLRTQAHFERYLGERVRIETRMQVEGRKRFMGRLVRVEDGEITLDLDTDGQVTFAIEGLHRARLIPEL